MQSKYFLHSRNIFVFLKAKLNHFRKWPGFVKNCVAVLHWSYQSGSLFNQWLSLTLSTSGVAQKSARILEKFCNRCSSRFFLPMYGFYGEPQQVLFPPSCKHSVNILGANHSIIIVCEGGGGVGRRFWSYFFFRANEALAIFSPASRVAVPVVGVPVVVGTL